MTRRQTKARRKARDERLAKANDNETVDPFVATITVRNDGILTSIHFESLNINGVIVENMRFDHYLNFRNCSASRVEPVSLSIGNDLGTLIFDSTNDTALKSIRIIGNFTSELNAN